MILDTGIVVSLVLYEYFFWKELLKAELFV